MKTLSPSDAEKITVAGLETLDAEVAPIHAAVTKAQLKLMNDLDKAEMFDELVKSLALARDCLRWLYAETTVEKIAALVERARALQERCK